MGGALSCHSQQRVSFDVDDAADAAQVLHSLGWTKTKEQLLALKGVDALRYINCLDELCLNAALNDSQKRQTLRLLLDLCDASHQVPTTLFIDDVHTPTQPTNPGTFANIYKGHRGSKPVAVKRLRPGFSGTQLDVVSRAFLKEIVLRSHLEHPNIMPVLGIDRDGYEQGRGLGIVDHWMERGTILEFINSSHYSPGQHRRKLFLGFTSGLNYLHEQRFIHGDIHDGNVLITDDGVPRFTDLETAVIGEFSRSHPATTSGSVGRDRWLAPEVFEDESYKTFAGDVFACGRMYWAICTKVQPFNNVESRRVQAMVIKHKQPARPTNDECDEVLWTIIKKCWKKAPHRRPTMHQVSTAIVSHFN